MIVMNGNMKGKEYRHSACTNPKNMPEKQAQVHDGQEEFRRKHD